MLNQLSSDPLAALFILGWLVIMVCCIPAGIRDYRQWAKDLKEFERLNKK